MSCHHVMVTVWLVAQASKWWAAKNEPKDFNIAAAHRPTVVSEARRRIVLGSESDERLSLLVEYHAHCFWLDVSVREVQKGDDRLDPAVPGKSLELHDVIQSLCTTRGTPPFTDMSSTLVFHVPHIPLAVLQTFDTAHHHHTTQPARRERSGHRA